MSRNLSTMAILGLDEYNVIRNFVMSRLDASMHDRIRCNINKFRRPIFDIFLNCERFGLPKYVLDMYKGNTTIIGKIEVLQRLC